MIKCAESNETLKAGQEVFVVTRMHDPEAFPLSKKTVERIPKKWRTTHRHTYKNSGGVNIHRATITGSNGSSEICADRDILFFSIPKYKVRDLLPNAAQNFRFPE